ncbi:hypothetical protein GCM10023201_33690 [Actinomycetospora corticicola]|uniref:Biotin carboxylase n=1 Tax=Actinomycetospora corticicola TaxID=663602 RepID=A0A7Y9J3W8_9PSEU|nr:ATP-grasp domain-containing protein [Actinomycetospora corticicola]NYD34508.1 biotin carboxylase [Actinomycetospora corticicola]
MSLHVLVVELPAYRPLDTLADLVAEGVRISLLARDPESAVRAAGGDPDGVLTRCIAADPEDTGTAADAVLAACADDPVHGVICTWHGSLVAAARLAQRLGLPHEEPDRLDRLQDKAEMRALLAAAGLDDTEFRRVTDARSLTDAVAALRPPLVVKPCRGSGSIGVHMVDTPEDVSAIGADGLAAPLLVERRLAGRLCSAELVVDGPEITVLGMTSRFPGPVDGVVELGGAFPAVPDGAGPALALARRVVAALGLRRSVVHVELMLTPFGPRVVEVNTRAPGNVVLRLMSRALGRTVALDMVRLACGLPASQEVLPVGQVALLQVVAEVDGRLRRAVLPPPGPRAGGRVLEAALSAEPGQAVRRPRTNRDRLGHVLVHADSVAELDTLVAAVTEEIALDVEPDPVPTTEAPVALLLRVRGTVDESTAGRYLTGAAAATSRFAVSGDLPPQAAALLARLAPGRASRPPSGTAEAPVAVLELGRTPRCAPWSGAGIGAVVGRLLDGTLHDAVVLLADGPVWRAVDVEDPAVVDPVLRFLDGEGDGPVALRIGDGSSRLLAHVDGDLLAIHARHRGRDLVADCARDALHRVGVPVRPGAGRGCATALAPLGLPGGRVRVVAAPDVVELRRRAEVAEAVVPVDDGQVVEDGRDDAGRDATGWVVIARPGINDTDGVVTAAAAVATSARLRTEALDRCHVLVLDRLGPATLVRSDGLLLDPARFRTTVFSAAPVSVWSPGATPDAVHTVDVFDPSAVVALADAVHRVRPVDRVVAASERLLDTAARLRARFGLPGADVAHVARYTDKAVMKQLASAAGIRHAPGSVVHDGDDVHAALARWGRIVLKPRRSSGSQGVTVCADVPQVEAWIAGSLAPGRFLVEAHVSGAMVHVDALVVGGRVRAWDASRYVRDTLAYQRGAPLSSVSVEEAGRDAYRAVLEAVVAAWDACDEVLHLEVFDDPDGPVFCEVAARPGGAGVVDAFRATRGVDLRHARVLLDVGGDVEELFGEPTAAHAGWTVLYSSGGRLAHYDDRPVAEAAAVRTVPCVGDVVPPSRFSGTGMSKYVFAAPCPDEVAELVALAEAGVVATFEEEDR